MKSKNLTISVASGCAFAFVTLMVGAVLAQNIDTLSLGSTARFAGLAASTKVNLAAVCPVAGQAPGDRCVVIDPVPGNTTAYDEQDLGYTVLPKAVVRRINLIYPITNITYEYQFQNTTGAQVPNGFFSTQPYLTFESNSPALNDPACIDPNTGMACGGKAVIFISATNTANRSLAAGERDREHRMFSRAGSVGIGKQSFLNVGWPQATVDEIFDRAITIRLNVKGSARYVTDAFVNYELRLFVDY